MNPHTHITIVALAILVFQGMFALWVIDKLRSISDRPTYPDVPQHLLKDMRQMQTDIINLKQDCINIDNKYRIKDEWTTSKLEQITGIQKKLVAFMDSCEIPSENDTVKVQDILDKMAEQGLQGRTKNFVQDRDLGDENDR